jgi:hypothetical protein
LPETQSLPVLHACPIVPLAHIPPVQSWDRHESFVVHVAPAFATQPNPTMPQTVPPEQLGSFCPTACTHIPLPAQNRQLPRHGLLQQAPLTQWLNALAQSEGCWHIFPPPHPGHTPPPQSMSVSLWFLIPSSQAHLIGMAPHPPAVGVPGMLH